MSHAQQLEFVTSVKARFPESFVGKRVLEVGSLDINGSVRQFFEGCTYLGVDLGEGKGVDLVCPGHLLNLPDNTFDTVISCECFEHDKHWQQTFLKMVSLSNHLVVFTCATDGRREHGTTASDPEDAPFTHDYYKNLGVRDFVQAIDFPALFDDFCFFVESGHHDLCFWGEKRKA